MDDAPEERDDTPLCAAARVSDLTKAFMEAADDLIRSVITKQPFRLKQGHDTKEPAWVTFQQKRDGIVPPEERLPRFSKPV